MGIFDNIVNKVKKATEAEDEEYINDNYSNESYDSYDSQDYGDNDDYQSSDNDDFGSFSYDYDFKSSPSYSNPFSSSAPQNEKTNLYRLDNTSNSTSSKVSKVVYFVLEDAEDARGIADCMIKKDTIILADLSNLSAAESSMVLNFLDGVRYICKSNIENIKNIHLIVPDTIELTGDFLDQVGPNVFSD